MVHIQIHWIQCSYVSTPLYNTIQYTVLIWGTWDFSNTLYKTENMKHPVSNFHTGWLKCVVNLGYMFTLLFNTNINVKQEEMFILIAHEKKPTCMTQGSQKYSIHWTKKINTCFIQVHNDFKECGVSWISLHISTLLLHNKHTLCYPIYTVTKAWTLLVSYMS
jgi:hypothetical protein